MRNKIGPLEAVVIVIAGALLLNLSFIVYADQMRKKQYEALEQKMDVIASHTDALDQVMVDFNYELVEIKNNQEEMKQTQEEQFNEIDKTFDKIWNSIHKHKDELEEQIKAVEQSKAETKKKTVNYTTAAASDSGYTHPFKSQGTTGDGTYNYTWYSQRELPGGGLDIPGRHVDDDGFIRDENGNLCIASSNHAKGTEIDTPYGKGVVYDYCPSDNLDIYTDW